MPEKQFLKTEFSNDCAVIRLTNPSERNPLSVAVLDALDGLIEEFDSRKDISKIIFTGTSDVFASGANLREISRLTKDDAPGFALRGQLLMNKIAASRKRTIAAVNGSCFGGALDLALACQSRIASPVAIFCHPGANLGIITGWGGTQRLPRLIGQMRALEMFLTARRVNAECALKMKLIDKIAADPLTEALAN